MKKFISSNSIAQKKQWEAAENYNNFYWKFIKRVTGNKMEHYFWKYMLNSKDCAQEEIHETHGIIIVNGEGYYTYFIPKKNNNIKLINWVEDNLINKYRILRKTNIGFMGTEPTTWQREDSIKFTKEFNAKKNS